MTPATDARPTRRTMVAVKSGTTFVVELHRSRITVRPFRSHRTNTEISIDVGLLWQRQMIARDQGQS